jgi:hypothetical protein
MNTMMGFDPLFQYAYMYAYMQGERLDHFSVAGSGSLRQALERLNRSTDTYAGQAEAEIDPMVRSGAAGMRAVQDRGKELEQHMDAYVTRSERRVAGWVERTASRMAAWWRRFTRWRDTD